MTSIPSIPNVMCTFDAETAKRSHSNGFILYYVVHSVKNVVGGGVHGWGLRFAARRHDGAWTWTWTGTETRKRAW